MRNAVPKAHDVVATFRPGPNGQDVLTDPRLAAIVRDEVMMVAEAAREDPVAFAMFVMRRFDTNGPIARVPDHHKVMIEFLLAHDRAVLLAGVGLGKTFAIVTLLLWFLGRDPTERWAVVSATEHQAQKILTTVREYIEVSPELHLVFPHLRRGQRSGDPWTTTAMTVDRPRGFKDPTLIAIGIDGTRIIGSRLNGVIGDDLLTLENTATKEQREKVTSLLDSQVLSRLSDASKQRRSWLTNSAWHPQDALHLAEARGWASMRMSILGDITILDDSETPRGREFDSPLLRPAAPHSPVCRLACHDPDPDNVVPLWPEERPRAWIEKERRVRLPYRFQQLYCANARDDGSSMCKAEYIHKCFEVARQHGVHSMVAEYRGPNPTFTGLDLAISPGEEADDTAFFTFESRPDGVKVILDVEYGKWSGPDIVRKLFQKIAAYNSVARVENNGAQQYLIQYALEHDVSAPIKPHTTGRTKAHPEHGVAGMFLEMSNGAWAFPVGRRGQVHPMVQRFADACLDYTPSRHTDDGLMANYFAREQAKKFGALRKRDPDNAGRAGGIAGRLMAR